MIMLESEETSHNINSCLMVFSYVMTSIVFLQGSNYLLKTTLFFMQVSFFMYRESCIHKNYDNLMYAIPSALLFVRKLYSLELMARNVYINSEKFKNSK